MNKRSLYECFNARVRGEHIYCAKGHSLNTRNRDGTISALRLARGEPLVMAVCQDCADFDSMGDPIPAEERGYVVEPEKFKAIVDRVTTRASHE